MCQMGMDGCIDEGGKGSVRPARKLGGVFGFMGVTGS